MNHDEFKEMYLLYRQQNMTLIDLRIIYGKQKADDFQKEMDSRMKSVDEDESAIKKYNVDIDFTRRQYDKDKASQ